MVSRTHARLREWLKPADVSQNQRAAEDRHHPGTGKWFEETEEFKQWKSTSLSLLWLHGISGCGKTVLSSTIIKKLRDNGDTVTYFYFDTTNDQKKKAEDFLCTLISRLSDSASHAAKILESFWNSHANGAEAPSNQTLLEILIKILSGFATPVYIVCDALDESSEVGLVLNTIGKIVDAKINNIHVFLTSRTEVTHGKELFSLATAVCLKGTQVNKDIASYVDHVLATDQDFSWSKEIKNDVRDSLANQSDPMFRLVALQLDQLRSCLRESDIAPALSRMPHTINRIYDRILENIQSDVMLGMVNQTLNWLLFSIEPVTLEQINDALAVDFTKSPPRFNPKKRLTTPSKLLNACAGLVSATKGWRGIILQFAHASVKEYLTDSQRSSLALQGEISNDVGHHMIARTCIAYLCSFDNHNILKSSPLGLYAAKNWHHHVNRYNPGLTELPNPYAPKRRPKYQLGNAYFFQLWESIQGADVNAQGGKYGNALQAACYQENTEIVQMLLERGADVNAEGGQYDNALQAACDHGNTEIAQMLLNGGADVNAQGGNYGNALQAACCADVNAQGGQYGNALKAACALGNITIVQMLLDSGADVNAQGGYYGNTLQAACNQRNIEIIQVLLDSGADVNAQGGYYGNALQAACVLGNTKIVQMLLDSGADVNADGGQYSNALKAACALGNTNIVLML
ncbi:ankyrin repeat-containing domain protein, partial [Mycena sanguinolenta]